MEESTYEIPHIDEHVFDLSSIPVTSEIISMRQVGNFVEAVSANGQKFRHSIPAGKILNKNTKGEWILEPMNLS